VVNLGGTLALMAFLRARLRRLELRETVSAVARIVAASVPLAIVSYLVWRGIEAELGHSFGAQLVALAVALAAGIAVYLLACRLLRVRELQALLSLRGRSRRA
jgi:hypothetical protein